MLRNLTEQLSVTIRRATDFLHSKYMRRTLFIFSIMSVMVGLFIFANPVQAQGLTDVANGMINAVSYILIAIAGIFMQITIFALKFFIEIAGYNNYIDASIVKLGWNMVRDVANMFFVVILLVIAFGTILGLEQYEWKKTLAKLIMSAFLVNFSNLICQVIIDVSQVFTITFLNAIAGAAGGNLIKMFNFDEILQIAERGTDPSGIQIELFAGAVMTIVFAGMAMATIGAYLVVIIARMVVLWTLMILSPLAFLFSALPSTQSHAQEFWNQFTHQVIVAPVMVFFLWLAFATFGGGDIVQQDIEQNHPLIADGGIRSVTESTDVNGNSLGVTFSKAASWENMANFAVAIAFLWIGLERVQKLGVVGGGLVSGAMQFGKNVATIASGYALGRWMTGKGVDGLKAGAKGIGSGLYTALAKNRVEIIGNWGKRQVEGWGAFRAAPPPVAMEDKRKDAGVLSADTIRDIAASKKDDNGVPDLQDGMLGTNKEGKSIKYDKSRRGWYELDEKNPDEWAKDYDTKTGNVKREWARDAEGKIVPTPDTRNPIQKALYNRQMALIQSRKNLEKVKNTAKTRDDLIDKRVTAAPKYFMQKFEGDQPDAFDRMEQGMLEAEQMRSAAKTEEFKALGKELVLGNTRFKDGKYQEGETVAQQIAGHKTRAAVNENLVKKVQADARRDYMKDKGKNFVKASIKADLQVKAAEGEAKAFEAGALAQITNESAEASQALRDKHKRGEITAEQLAAEEKKNEENLFIARKIAAEKQEHQLGINAKASEKKEEAAYLKGAHGQAELQQEAVALAATAASEAAIKTLTGDAETAAMKRMEEEVLKNPNKAVNPFADKVVAELDATRAETQKKEEEAALARNLKEHNKGVISNLQATEASKLAISGHEGKSKAAEGAARDVAKDTEKGIQGLREAGEAKVQSQAQDSTFQGIEGAAYTAAVQAAVAAAEAASKVAGSQALSLIDQINLGEQVKKGSEDLVKQLKNNALKAKYREAMNAITGKNEQEVNAMIAAGGPMASYLAAMKHSQVLKSSEADLAKNKDLADSEADALFVDMKRKGYTVPSLAAATYAKRNSAELTQAGDQGRADATSRNIAHMLQLISSGEEIDEDIKDEMLGTLFATMAGGNVDDAVRDIAKKINLLTDKGTMKTKYGFSDEQISGIEKLKEFAISTDLVTRNRDTGEFDGNQSPEANARLIQFMSTGGDIDMVRTHHEFTKFASANPTLQYEEAMQKFFSDSTTKKYGQYTSEKSLTDALNEKQAVLIAAQEEAQQSGVRTSHFQYVGALTRDEKTGNVRFTTSEEAQSAETSQKVKNQNNKLPPQALGVMNTTSGFVEFDANRFANSNLARNNNAVTFLQVTQDRTPRTMTGGVGGEKGLVRDGEILLGRGAAGLALRGEGDLETGVMKLMRTVFLRQLQSSASSISLAAHTDVGNNTRAQAEAGIIKGKIEGLTILDDNGNSISDAGKIYDVEDLVKKMDLKIRSVRKHELKKWQAELASATTSKEKAGIQARIKEFEDFENEMNAARSLIEGQVSAQTTLKQRYKESKEYDGSDPSDDEDGPSQS